MRHHGVRPGVAPGVSSLVPRVHVRKAEVCATALNIEGGNHWSPSVSVTSGASRHA